jgi:hypothetical protein
VLGFGEGVEGSEDDEEDEKEVDDDDDCMSFASRTASVYLGEFFFCRSWMLREAHTQRYLRLQEFDQAY